MRQVFLPQRFLQENYLMKKLVWNIFPHLQKLFERKKIAISLYKVNCIINYSRKFWSFRIHKVIFFILKTHPHWNKSDICIPSSHCIPFLQPYRQLPFILSHVWLIQCLLHGCWQCSPYVDMHSEYSLIILIIMILR